MISRLAKSTACFFVDNKIIEAEDAEVYSYGMELLISTVLNFAVAIVIAVATKSILPCLVNLAAFLTLRVNAGGYHADTHLGCTMTLVSTLLIFIFAEKNISEVAMFFNSLMMLLLSNILIIMLSPVEHPNKPISEDMKRKLRDKSVKWAGIWTVFCIVFIVVDVRFCFYAASGVFTIAMAMIAEKIKLKEKIV